MPSTKHHGFTLIELLTVVFIVGVIITFASLSVNQHSDQTLEEEAKRLRHLIQLASEEAVMSATTMAVQFDPQGYQFATLVDRTTIVTIEEDRLLRKRQFPPEMEFELEINGRTITFDEEDRRRPTIMIWSSGEMTPFKLTLNLDDSKPYTIIGNVIGQLDLIPPGVNTDDFGA